MSHHKCCAAPRNTAGRFRVCCTAERERHAEPERATARRGTALTVPKGPQGQKRPADVVGCAVHVARIATGEIEIDETTLKKPNKVRAGQAGARARKASLTPDERSAIARKAAAARWSGV